MPLDNIDWNDLQRQINNLKKELQNLENKVAQNRAFTVGELKRCIYKALPKTKICTSCVHLNKRRCPWINPGSGLTGVRYMIYCSAFLTEGRNLSDEEYARNRMIEVQEESIEGGIIKEFNKNKGLEYILMKKSDLLNLEKKKANIYKIGESITFHIKDWNKFYNKYIIEN